jgi:hypothetical protein
LYLQQTAERFMAAIASHFFHGKTVLKSFHPSDKIVKTVNKNIDTFYLGCQGSDIFMYYNPLKRDSITAIGHDIHASSMLEWLTNARKYVKTDCYALSYTAGVICHYTLDIAIHSFLGDTSKHFYWESALDNTVIKENGFLPSKIKLSKLLPSDPRILYSIRNLYSRYYDGLSLDHVSKSISMFKLYRNLLSRERFYFKYITALLDIDSGFLDLIVKDSYPKSETIDKLYTLYNNAIPAAVENIRYGISVLLSDGEFDERFNSNFKGETKNED